mmetsp:Transcript_18110/g.27618  ORF Transcript_18110/g.27618 Transcript_18110/m.27618 type:complete len:138 (+) Transcript_18110:56-469(+)
MTTYQPSTKDPSQQSQSQSQQQQQSMREQLPFSTNGQQQSSTDSKKEEFRKYLEKSGVVDALTKVLVGLYEEPERPVNAIEYIKRYLGASSSNNNSGKNSNNNNMSDGLSNSIKKENEELKAKVEKLTRALEEAKDK